MSNRSSNDMISSTASRESACRSVESEALMESSAVATVGNVAAFAVAYAILVVGVANFTVAGHAWISHRVAFARRGRSMPPNAAASPSAARK